MKETIDDKGYQIAGAKMVRICLVLLGMSLGILEQSRTLVAKLQTMASNDRIISITGNNVTYALAAKVTNVTSLDYRASSEQENELPRMIPLPPHNAYKDDNSNRTAIVWMSRYLDACGVERLRHLIATAGAANDHSTRVDTAIPIHPRTAPRDVWILHNHNTLQNSSSEYQTSIKYLQELEDYARDHQLGGIRFYSAQQNGTFSKNFDDHRAGASKTSFLEFVTSYGYGWAWHLEDDVFYTGRWKEIFGEEYQVVLAGNNGTSIGGGRQAQQQQQQQQSPAYDMIATGHHVGTDWYWFQDEPCFFRLTELNIPLGTKCSQVASNMTRWGIIRLSGSFANTLLTNVKARKVVGHHEAVVPSICRLYNYTCSVDYIKHRIGKFVTAGWGKWMNSRDQTLTKHGTIQPNKLYHPVKCAAYPGRDKTALTQHLLY